MSTAYIETDQKMASVLGSGQYLPPFRHRQMSSKAAGELIIACKDRTKVLVADDSAVYRKLVEHALPSDRYSVLLAKSGHEAIEILDHQHPEIVITDWVMPDITGIELCQRIRAGSHASYIYVILLTSVSEKENIVTGLAAGADDYLTKPFHAGELLARAGVGQRIIDLHRQIEAKSHLLEQLARTDPLTGLPNRRAIEEWASRQISGARRYGFPLWVALADLDNFKSVNDTFGHEAGDIVLKKFSEILKINTRRSNICGRIGGEEFLIVLTHTDESHVRLAMDRIRKTFEEHSFTFGERTLKVTTSFGISGFLGKLAPDFNSLVNHADKALYSAKNLGRNRIEICVMESTD
jgi:diguanylate cyclase (GGDEF)-like protein